MSSFAEESSSAYDSEEINDGLENIHALSKIKKQKEVPIPLSI